VRVAAIAMALVACTAPRRVGSPCGGEPAFTPFDEPAVAAPPAPPDGVLDRFVAWYQAYGRARDPGGCRFAPTCSAYAREALPHYGPLVGLVMIVDRLIVREHAFATDYYPLTCVDHVTRLDDAIP
jgi:putative component of membrane protein insertase Oxa1/YidC/SpoIIIJ protein YidD